MLRGVGIATIPVPARHQVAEGFIGHALAAVQLSCLERQNSACTPVSVLNGSWSAEDEPGAPAIERWIAGLSQRTDQQERLETTFNHETGQVEVNLGTSSSVSGAVPQQSSQCTLSLENVVQPGAGGHSGSLGYASAKFQVVAHDQDSRLREELAVRKEQQAALQSKREVGEVERHHLEHLRQQLCGKLHAYNHKGQLVLVTPIDPYKLPRPMHPNVEPARTNSAAGHKSAAVRGSSDVRPAGASVRGYTRDSVAKNNIKDQKIMNDFIERPDVSTLSPFGIMQLQPGVTIRGVLGVRTGCARKPDCATMTRSEFQTCAFRKANTACNTAGMLTSGRGEGNT